MAISEDLGIGTLRSSVDIEPCPFLESYEPLGVTDGVDASSSFWEALALKERSRSYHVHQRMALVCLSALYRMYDVHLTPEQENNNPIRNFPTTDRSIAKWTILANKFPHLLSSSENRLLGQFTLRSLHTPGIARALMENKNCPALLHARAVNALNTVEIQKTCEFPPLKF